MKPRSNPRRNTVSTPASTRLHRRGFTLVEMAISATILFVLLGVVGLAALTGDKAFHVAAAKSEVEARARRVVDRIADQVAMCGATALTPSALAPLGSSTLDFKTPTGLAGSTITWGDTSRIQFQYTTRDPNDGKDNDGNGLVDDGQVVLVQHVGLTTQKSTVLVRGVAEFLQGETPNAKDDNSNGLVDEKGLSFDRVGEKLTIRLTLGEKDPEGDLVVRSAQTTIKIRN